MEGMKEYVCNVDGREETVRKGSTFLDIAKKDQQYYPDEILLAKYKNKLYELYREVPGDGDIELITGMDNNGRRTYRRGVVLLMQKALANLFPDEHPDVIIRHSLGQGYFCILVSEHKVTADLLKKLKAEMNRLVKLDLPLKKYSVQTSEARKLFHKERLFDKERLLRYRNSSYINVYELDGFIDYFYGYMVPSTGYLKTFDLKLYEEGFMLLFPYKDTRKVAPFEESPKLFEVQRKSADWSSLMNIPTVGALNDVISSGQSLTTILMQEALMEQRIGALAVEIANHDSAKFIMIAGPSSSGKTTFSYRLSIQLMAQGLHPHPLSLDDYYLDRDKMIPGPDGKLDLESIDGIDIEQFNKDMTALLNGEEVDMPTFNFKRGKREYHGKKLKLGEDDVLVIEGIHGLNDKLSYTLPKESKFKIYISALTMLAIDEHNPLSTTDGRLIRRIVRDARTRGSNAEETLGMWDSVRRGEEKNIFPFQESCDAMFNSALIYEMSVLKLYAVPLLMEIHEDSPAYPEAKRLLKLLDYFLPLPPDAVNNTSLLREFIGGSILKV